MGHYIFFMQMPADYHMHTPLCGHASGWPVEYAGRARDLGFHEIGFSDHSPMRQDGFDNWRMRLDQLDEYVDSVVRARTEYPDLAIRLALEVDYLPGHEDWIRELTQRHSWDYLIGSVHYVSGSWAVDDPSQISQWKERNPEEVWTAYFERLTAAAASGLFDIIGHADLPKKFGFRPHGDGASLFSSFLKAAQKTGVAVELNTAGLRKDCREIYPSLAFTRLLFQKGIPITFGSDAHFPEEVGMNFVEAIHQAQQAGYTHWTRFEQRKAQPVML